MTYCVADIRNVEPHRVGLDRYACVIKSWSELFPNSDSYFWRQEEKARGTCIRPVQPMFGRGKMVQASGLHPVSDWEVSWIDEECKIGGPNDHQQHVLIFDRRFEIENDETVETVEKCQ